MITTPAGLPVAVTYNGGSAWPVSAGSYAVHRRPYRARNYDGTVSDTLVIGEAPQAINFAALADIPWMAAPTCWPLRPTAGGLPVAFNVANGPASLCGNLLTPMASGPVAVVAAQAGDGNFLPAAPVGRSFTVTRDYLNCRWRQLHFTAAELPDSAVSGEQADPDGDGLVDFIEYAMQTDPHAVAIAEPPLRAVTVMVAGQPYQALRFRRRVVNPEIEMRVETSTSLVSWQHGEPLTAEVGEALDNGDGTETITIRSTQPYATALREFLRLRVIIAP